MGVPAFFRWLCMRYPKILIQAREKMKIGFNLEKLCLNNFGIDDSMPKIDNLYFDMNGIIHPCAHPEDSEAPNSLAEIFNNIFDYCDKIIEIVKPRKLIYMAIDGVAPRAKMNQQRSRRFRSALSAQQSERITSLIEKEWREKGLPTDFLEQKKKKHQFKFDSNCITPGTEFLDQCSIAIRTYIKSRINNDPLWYKLNVVFSDSSVPGEGEHKILDFIRTQRTYNTYDPNTYHCIYGADADLIMLSLIMHEPHFCVIRESLLICSICGKQGHRKGECYTTRNKTPNKERNFKSKIDKIEFSLIKIGYLREYLEIEFKCLIEKRFDFERIIDDFVLLCFLVGNDFLPNMPSLKIREGAIDALIFLYKKIRPEMKDYLTNGKGKLNLTECEILFKKLSVVEDKFFQNEIMKKPQDINNKVKIPKITLLQTFRQIKQIQEENKNKHKYRKDNEMDLDDEEENISSKKKDKYLSKFTLRELKLHGEEIMKDLIQEAINEENNQKVEEYEDKIQLGIEGWKERYYKEKFHVSEKLDQKALVELKEKIKQYYIEGLCWVFEYYYNGCISWSWFYPFHYAPFASDLVDLNKLEIKFELNKPFYAFEQLLSVLPPYSTEALPVPFRKLMTDPQSPLADFYPSNIKLDINNQPYAWMGVNLLPFVDADRIQKIVQKVIYKKGLTQKEKKLNERGDNILITTDWKIYNHFQGNLRLNKTLNTYGKYLKGDYEIKGIYPGNVRKDISNIYTFKKKENGKTHSSKLLLGVKKVPKYILEDNFDKNSSSKKKFQGKTAIEIVEEVFGWKNDDIEEKIMNEFFDPLYGNNNQGMPNDPEMKLLLMKKRAKENEFKLHRATIINNQSNNKINKNEEKLKAEIIPLDEEKTKRIRKERKKKIIKVKKKEKKNKKKYKRKKTCK